MRINFAAERVEQYVKATNLRQCSVARALISIMPSSAPLR